MKIYQLFILLCFITIAVSQYALFTFYTTSGCNGVATYQEAEFITSCVSSGGAFYESYANSTTYTELLGCTSPSCDPSECYVDSKPMHQCLLDSYAGVNTSYTIEYYPTMPPRSYLVNADTIYIAYFDGTACNIANEIDAYTSSFCGVYNTTAFHAYKCSNGNVQHLICTTSTCSSCVVENSYTEGQCINNYGDYNKFFCGDASSVVPSTTTGSGTTQTTFSIMLIIISLVLAI